VLYDALDMKAPSVEVPWVQQALDEQLGLITLQRPSISGERRAIREGELRQDKQRGHDSRKHCLAGKSGRTGERKQPREESSLSTEKKKLAAGVLPSREGMLSTGKVAALATYPVD
jgi:hypothetical protein